jgi:hypothetical protein
MRAERRLGELIKAQKETVGLATGGDAMRKQEARVENKPELNSPPTLAEAGIDKNLANVARKAAAKPAEEFEAELEQKVNRIVRKGEPKEEPALNRRSEAELFLAAAGAITERLGWPRACRAANVRSATGRGCG